MLSSEDTDIHSDSLSGDAIVKASLLRLHVHSRYTIHLMHGLLDEKWTICRRACSYLSVLLEDHAEIKLKKYKECCASD